MRTRLAIFLVCFNSLAFAASDFQTWAGLFVEKPFARDWLLWGDFQDRLYDGSSKQRTLLARVGVGYEFSKTHSVWFGYAWTPLLHPTYLDEHRLWQQTLARYQWGDWSLSFRFRLEQRWLGGGGTAWRWREQVRVAWRFLGTTSAVLSDEFFFNFNTTPNITHKGFQQNRLFLGPRFMLSDKWAIEAGYMNVISLPNDMFHVASLSLIFREIYEEPLP